MSDHTLLRMLTKAKWWLTSGVWLLTIFVLPRCTPQKNKRDKKEGALTWERVGPGGGGATFIPTFSFESPEKFIVRCDMTGSYLSADGGSTYKQINFPNGANAFAFDPNDPASLWIGSAVLSHSTDSGATWNQVFPAAQDVENEKYYGDHGNYNIETKELSIYNNEVGQIGAIRVDPVQQGALYFSMGSVFYFTADFGKTWKQERLQERIDLIYTNTSSLQKEVYIFTAKAVYRFNKASSEFTRTVLPPPLSPAFSFTAGTEKGSDKVVLYALHQDVGMPVDGEFGFTEVWQSADMGATWRRIVNPIITNKASGLTPSYSMISCAEHDAGTAYLVCNRYEEVVAGGKRYWYGALKSDDSGKEWAWVWKGGGGSGNYGVKDGMGVANLHDAWVELAFGGEYIRLMDVGVYPGDGDVAIVTDWYRTMKTIDGGKSWDEIYSVRQPDSTFTSRGMDVTTAYGVHFDPFDSSHLAISYTDIGYHHSFNSGKSWSRSASGVPAGWVNTCYDVVFDPAIQGKVWSAWSGMHDFPRGKMTRDPQWKEKAMGGVCMSLDGGKTWRASVVGMGFDSPVTSIVIDPQSPAGQRTLYVSVYNKGIFKSTDDGNTWEIKNKGIGANTCAFEITLTNKGELFVTISAAPMHKGGKKGREYYSGDVYKSTDGAETWTRLVVRDGPLFPNGMDYDRERNRIYLACWSDLELSDLVGGDVARTTGGNENIDMGGGIFLSEDGGGTWRSIFDEQQYVYDITVDPYHPGRLYCNTFNHAAYRSDDYGKTWGRLAGYDFHWGHRVIVDENNRDQIYLTTFGSSVWRGKVR